VKELTVIDSGAKVNKSVEAVPPPVSAAEPKLPKPERPVSAAPKMRSYSWALSGDFNAKMELFGEARTEEDIDALKEYVDITIKALKRSLKADQASATSPIR
jgi:hypothetical protein